MFYLMENKSIYHIDKTTKQIQLRVLLFSVENYKIRFITQIFFEHELNYYMQHADRRSLSEHS